MQPLEGGSIMKTLIAILSLLILSACNQAVQLRHTVTGKIVQCGPYNALGGTARITAVERERGCVYDYQRQGYERM